MAVLEDGLTDKQVDEALVCSCHFNPQDLLLGERARTSPHAVPSIAVVEGGFGISFVIELVFSTTCKSGTNIVTLNT